MKRVGGREGITSPTVKREYTLGVTSFSLRYTLGVTHPVHPEVYPGVTPPVHPEVYPGRYTPYTQGGIPGYVLLTHTERYNPGICTITHREV